MQVTINGETRDIAEGLTIQALLEHLKLSPQATVVQRNDDIVDRDVYGTLQLEPGDTLELVRFVGGG